MQFVMSYSCGKDSTLALHKMVEAGHTPVALLVTQRVIDTKTNEIKCICKSIMVTFDLERHESMPLTEEWIEAICKYEGRDLRKKK